MAIDKIVTVGLTGGIGSGKTSISKAFQAIGIPVYNSDLRSRELSNTDERIIAGLKQQFGDDIYQLGQLDRKRVASIVFKDIAALQQINRLIHPIVESDFIEWAQKQTSKYVINEAAILVENGSYKQFDKLILVVSPENMRINRVVKRDKISKEQVTERIKMQMSDEEKSRVADFIITSDDREYLIPQILDI